MDILRPEMSAVFVLLDTESSIDWIWYFGFIISKEFENGSVVFVAIKRSRFLRRLPAFCELPSFR
jgi:hypothetical protein